MPDRLSLATWVKIFAASIALVMSLMSLGFTLVFVALSHRIQENDKAHDALCFIRHDREVRVVRGNKFLRLHPKGVPALGFTAAQIQESINADQQTVDALRILDC